jgi:hypothetical protein
MQDAHWWSSSRPKRGLDVGESRDVSTRVPQRLSGCPPGSVQPVAPRSQAESGPHWSPPGAFRFRICKAHTRANTSTRQPERGHDNRGARDNRGACGAAQRVSRFVFACTNRSNDVFGKLKLTKCDPGGKPRRDFSCPGRETAPGFFHVRNPPPPAWMHSKEQTR